MLKKEEINISGMKVLWLCNVIIPQVSDKLGMESGSGGGWMNQLADLMDESEKIELGICAPYAGRQKLTKVTWGKGSVFYGFNKDKSEPWIYDESIEKKFETILLDFKPDIVHIFGTEYPHTLAMVRAFGKPACTVIHIQGLVSVYYYYYAYLPVFVPYRFTFRDLLKRDNIAAQKRKFRQRGQFEIEALKNVGHVMGRTDWDRAHVMDINPTLKYHYVQEMMRTEFYSGRWDYQSCQKHAIFMSQGSYPIKGLHLMLAALRNIVKDYPDAVLYVAGSDIVDFSDWNKLIRRTYYQKYIASIIKKWDLSSHVVFTGILDAARMKEMFLKCNVFVSASSQENSPNSIGEALLLGVPIVTSDAGGVSSLLSHGNEGYIYRVDDVVMLEYYVKKVFVGDCEHMSECAYERARKQYDRQEIEQGLTKTYYSMMCKKEEQL